MSRNNFTHWRHDTGDCFSLGRKCEKGIRQGIDFYGQGGEFRPPPSEFFSSDYSERSASIAFTRAARAAGTADAITAAARMTRAARRNARIPG